MHLSRYMTDTSEKVVQYGPVFLILLPYQIHPSLLRVKLWPLTTSLYSLQWQSEQPVFLSLIFVLYKCVFLGLIFSFFAFGQIIEFTTKILIFNLFTILFIMDLWLKCGSLKCKTDDNVSAFSVVENSTSADKVPSLKKSHKYCPSYLNGIFHSK